MTEEIDEFASWWWLKFSVISWKYEYTISTEYFRENGSNLLGLSIGSVYGLSKSGVIYQLSSVTYRSGTIWN